MLTVGVTGKLGAGKSTVCRALGDRGAEVLDADAISRELLAPGSPLEVEVLEAFGPGAQGPDGSLDRRALAQRIFASETDRRRLEELTHPRIRAEIMHRRDASRSRIVVIELPLLDRARAAEYELDATVVVELPTDVAVARAVSRGMVEDDVRARLRAQPSDESRHALADWVVDNSGPASRLEGAMDELWAWLVQRADKT